MMNRLLIGYLAPCLVGCASAGAAFGAKSNSACLKTAMYRVLSVTTDRTVRGPLRKIDTVIQVGTNPTNQFTMHHVYHQHGVVKGSIILVPSLVNNFNEYMISDKHGARDSLALGLASAHFDVYGYSPRTAHLPPHACTTGGFDCSVMKDWNVATYVQDVEFIRAQAATHGEKPVVGGLSLGAVVGAAAVNANPSGYSGLLLWEGAVLLDQPSCRRIECAKLLESPRGYLGRELL